MALPLRSTDVFVVGGGPAGLAAAIAARQQGFDVVVADSAHPSIDKACGEGLMPDSLKALHAVGVSLDGCETGSFRGIRFVGREGSVQADFPEGRGVGIRRTELHRTLQERAERVGVNTWWGVRVSGIRAGTVLVNGDALRCRWIIGADGQNSHIRKWAGLSTGTNSSVRIGMRQHFQVKPWSDFVEIHWANAAQAYVTPIGNNEICLAVIAKRRFQSFESGLAEFPELFEKLKSVPRTSRPKGAVTMTRRLTCVARGDVLLAGEASGSVDAITGDGLAISFRQALALASALSHENLSAYEAAHRQISRLPHSMANAMLLMDKSRWLRSKALRAFAQKPHLFEQLLSLHVGDGFRGFHPGMFIDLGWNLLTV